MRGVNHAEDFGWSNAPRFGGGGGGTTQTVQKADPWSGQQPYLTDIYSQGQALDQTAVPQYFPSSTYQPLGNTQNAIIGQVENTGMSGGTPALQAGSNFTQSVLSPGYTGATGGTFDAINPAIAAFGSGAGLGATNPAFGAGQGYLSNAINGGYVAPMAGAAGQNQSLLSREIGGAYLDPSTDPGFQNVVNTTLAKTMPGITSSFVNSGRMDSGLATRAASEGANDAIGGLTLQNYLTERQNQNAAGTQAAQNYLAERGLQAGAGTQASQNEGLMLGAMQNAQNLGSNNFLTQQGNQTKTSMLSPLIDQTQMGDLSTALNAGGMSQQDAQNAINANMARWNYNQMQPWNQLGLYSNIINQFGNPGSTVNTQQPYFNNTGAQVMSGVGTAATVAMAAAALFSDRRLKTDIHKIGESDSGFPLYTFRYKADPENTVRMGLMAQDVQKTRPDAVIKTPVGLAVDYIKALDVDA